MLNFRDRLINPKIDECELADQLATTGTAFIPDFLEVFAAEETFACLDSQVGWELAYRAGAESKIQTVAQLSAMSAEERQVFHGSVIEQARYDYQFAYVRYPMVDAHTQNWQPRLVLCDILEAINDPKSLDFFRSITSDPEIRKVELQATYYAPGHFLKQHNDSATTGDDRRYACVINLTKGWESHWGGLLQFVGDHGVTSTQTPVFNSCNLFKVPQDHQVSYVAPFATRPRYALTGWLRAD